MQNEELEEIHDTSIFGQPGFIRESFAEEFLALNRDWFTTKRNAFYGLQERAEGLLQVWAQTGVFPQTNGTWIYFESKFNEFIEVMRSERSLQTVRRLCTSKIF